MVQRHPGLRLCDKLGPDATQDLSNALEEVQNDMFAIATERFEGRLIAVGSELRQDMARMDSGIRITLAEGLAKIRTEMSDVQVNIIRWSFAFWITQFAATAALLGFVLRSTGH